jgi:hypothetical protein
MNPNPKPVCNSAQRNNKRLEELLAERPELSLSQCAALLAAEDDARLEPMTRELRNHMRMEVAAKLPHLRKLSKPTKEK